MGIVEREEDPPIDEEKELVRMATELEEELFEEQSENIDLKNLEQDLNLKEVS